jgi:hypothetical protein
MNTGDLDFYLPDFWYSRIPWGSLGYAWRDNSGHWQETDNKHPMSERIARHERDVMQTISDLVAAYRQRAADLLAAADGVVKSHTAMRVA